MCHDLPKCLLSLFRRFMLLAALAFQDRKQEGKKQGSADETAQMRRPRRGHILWPRPRPLAAAFYCIKPWVIVWGSMRNDYAEQTPSCPETSDDLKGEGRKNVFFGRGWWWSVIFRAWSGCHILRMVKWPGVLQPDLCDDQGRGRRIWFENASALLR